MQTECKAKAMDEEHQEAKSASASMEEDSSATAAAIAEEFSGAHAIIMGYTVTVLLSIMVILM